MLLAALTGATSAYKPHPKVRSLTLIEKIITVLTLWQYAIIEVSYPTHYIRTVFLSTTCIITYRSCFISIENSIIVTRLYSIIVLVFKYPTFGLVGMIFDAFLSER